MVDRCQGGWPALLKTYIRMHLLGSSGIATAGVALLLNGSPHVIFARVSNLLTDGDGHRVSWDWKGQGSMKPCIKHVNVLRKGSGLVHRRPGFVEITHARHADFRQWTTADACDCMGALSNAQEHVRDGRVTHAKYKDLEMAIGFSAIRRQGSVLSSLDRSCTLFSVSGGPLPYSVGLCTQGQRT